MYPIYLNAHFWSYCTYYSNTNDMLSIYICNCHVHSDMHQLFFTIPNGLNQVFSNFIFIFAHNVQLWSWRSYKQHYMQTCTLSARLRQSFHSGGISSRHFLYGHRKSVADLGVGPEGHRPQLKSDWPLKCPCPVTHRGFTLALSRLKFNLCSASFTCKYEGTCV